MEVSRNGDTLVVGSQRNGTGRRVAGVRSLASRLSVAMHWKEEETVDEGGGEKKTARRSCERGIDVEGRKEAQRWDAVEDGSRESQATSFTAADREEFLFSTAPKNRSRSSWKRPRPADCFVFRPSSSLGIDASRNILQL